MFYLTDRDYRNQVEGWTLDYFNSKEWLDVQDILDEREKEGVNFYPDRGDLFNALGLCHYADCSVAIIGQDPYPSSDACGIAFAVHRVNGPGHGGKCLPPTLGNIFKELGRDLQIPIPTTGRLDSWCRQGVLLWNAMPVYPPIAGFGLLTQEIIERLSGKGKIVFVFVGRKAQEYEKYVDVYNNSIICVSHPSPRGQISAKSRFVGSRVFSTINDRLNHHLKQPIDWTL